MNRRALRLRLVFALLFAAMLAPITVSAVAQEPAVTPPAPPQAPVVAPVAKPDFSGAWIGTGQMAEAPGNQLFTYLRIRRGSDKRTSVLVVAPQLLALDYPARDVRVIGASIAFSMDVRGVSLRFDGTLDASNLKLEGTWGVIGPSGTVEGPAQVWSVQRTRDVRELLAYEAWRGDLQVGAQSIPFAVAIGECDFGLVGAMDIPMQGARGIPLIVMKTAKGYHMTLPGGVDAIYDVERTAEGSLVGSMTQGSFTLPIHLRPAPGYKILGKARPQDPQPPFPYTEREVAISHPFGHSLAGTLTLPSDTSLARNGKFPAVVLVSGSGAQNRDEEILGHRPFAVIADAFARKGVAVLRYDDRGTGRSKGSFGGSDTFDFATDADAASESLKKVAEIDPDRIGILGHSEGGIIAPLVAMWQNEGLGASDPEIAAVSFIVLLAAPGQRGAEVLSWQTGEIMRAEGATEEHVTAVLQAYVLVMNALIDKQPANELRVATEALIRAQVLAVGAVLDEAALQATVDGAVAGMQDKWMSTFITYNPIRAIERCRVPVYAIAGDKDLQVDGVVNLALIASAAQKGGTPASTRLYSGLNHLFQPCTTGSVSEYGEIDTTFDATALNEMVSWVVKICGELKPRAARTPPTLPSEEAASVPSVPVPDASQRLQPATLQVKPAAPKSATP